MKHFKILKIGNLTRKQKIRILVQLGYRPESGEPSRFIRRAGFSELFQLWQDGKIAPLISETYPLDKAHEAIAKLESRSAIGKLVGTM